MPAPNDDFDAIIHNLQQPATETIDPTPYGATATPAKPGLTRRGKAAIGIGAAVLAGSTLIGYQIHSSNAAEREAKAQEIALKSQALKLEELRELNKASDKDRKVAATEAKARQASVDTCVKDHDHLVGKGYGSPSYRDVVEDCQAQYGTTINTGDMQAAAATNDTNNSGGGGGGGGNDGALLGVVALVGLLAFGVKKGTKAANPA
ncbi:hypothetical protein [Streptomyces sp. NBC_00842]|uniref:hypothetical protein n=1 Tax=Streptomyces sp. NBC_00842 TaxID=2975848 RepID=UPI002F91BAAF|nr:hypothetical protein OH821_45010 [Streptomyces sp. NBC_00842]